MLEELKELICNYVEVEPEKITLESKFVDDLGFNSFDFITLLGEVEEKYNVHVNEEEVLGLTTVGNAIDYIEKLRGTK
ncbi:MAG: acyl carrier protein [Oscillospiraceae bacterium]|nr:acyl carrier protein [Oscillospiraceae bacterium]